MENICPNNTDKQCSCKWVCNNIDNNIYIEYLWAYDWWLTYANMDWYINKTNTQEYHRVDNSKVLEKKQPIEYEAVYFKTETWYFKNLKPITQEVYDSIPKSETSGWQKVGN
jgi:hypothetical protein